MEEVENTLKKNRELQLLLRQKLISIQRALARNLHQQKQIETLGRSLTPATVVELTRSSELKTPFSAEPHPCTGPGEPHVFEEFYRNRLRNLRQVGAHGYTSYFADDNMDRAKPNKDSLKKQKILGLTRGRRNHALWSKRAFFQLKLFVSKKGRSCLKHAAKRNADPAKLTAELERIKTLPRFCNEIMGVDVTSIKWGK